jgi:hypothetical protein
MSALCRSHVQSNNLTFYSPEIISNCFPERSTYHDYGRSQVTDLCSENGEKDIADLNAKQITDHGVVA